MVILGADHDDPAATHPDLHQVDQIGPGGLELLLVDIPPGSVGIDAVAEQQFAAVDVADPGQHRLIHQQGTDRPAGLGNPGPSRGGVGIGA